MLLVVGVLVPIFTLLMAGCDDEIVEVNHPPSAPDGVFSITGDGQVTICWNRNPETDIAGYDIYWNDQPTGVFERIGTVGSNQTCFVDTDVQNGVTYFYAVAAFDQAGQASELSFEDIFDTPRPEGFDLVLFDYLGQDSNSSGYDFSTLSGITQSWSVSTTDVYFGSPNNIPALFGKGASIGVGVDIQDYGYIDLEDVDWAPDAGWSPSKQAELIRGHSYVVQIEDKALGLYHYAKVEVVSVNSAFAILNWAYQIDPGNPELAPGIGAAK